MACRCGVHRNAFECRTAAQLGPEWQYETVKLNYTIAATYTPDFIDPVTKTIRETKGHFPPEDRRKMLAVRKANPDWTFVLVFQNPGARIAKGSKTSYAMWAEKHGFGWERGPGAKYKAERRAKVSAMAGAAAEADSIGRARLSVKPRRRCSPMVPGPSPFSLRHRCH